MNKVFLSTLILFGLSLPARAVDPYAHFLACPPFDPCIPNLSHQDFVKAPQYIVRTTGSGFLSQAPFDGPLGPNAVLWVMPGHRLTMDGDATLFGLAVYPGGEIVTFDKSQKWEMFFFLVHLGGKLTIGTPAVPISEANRVVVEFRDAPINTNDPNASGFDPAQFRGFLAFGQVTISGSPKLPTFVRLAQAPQAGNSSLQLYEAVANWQPGDKLVIPDSRHLQAADLEHIPGTNATKRKQERHEELTVVSAGGTSLTLNRALSFDHPGAKNGDGSVAKSFDNEPLNPHVGNLTRSVVFQSANPAGTRGHVMFLDRAEVDVRYALFKDLGRTTTQPLDSATFDGSCNPTKVGTNQIGRYSIHMHHLYGANPPTGQYQYTLIGNAIDGSPKWGLAIHGSHYGLIRDNVIYNAEGSAIVGEDGSESFNLIEHNFGLKSHGPHALMNERYDEFFLKGVGFNMRAANNYIRRNVFADVNEGIAVYMQNTSSGDGANGGATHNPTNIPLFQGADTTKPGEFVQSIVALVPYLEMTHNEIYGTFFKGFGAWHSQMQATNNKIDYMVLWHHYNHAIELDYSAFMFNHLIIRGDGGRGIGAFGHNGNGPEPLTFTDMDAQNLLYAFYHDNRPTFDLRFIGGYFRNKDGIAVTNSVTGGFQPIKTTISGARFDAIPGNPLISVRPVFSNLWKNGDWYMQEFNFHNIINLINYQGVQDNNLQVYFTEQHPDYVIEKVCADLPDPYGTVCTCPEDGLTNEQCWNQYQSAFLMEVARCTTVHPEIPGLTCPALVDTTPPDAPTNVKAIPNNGGEIELSWDAANDPESGNRGYEIYRNGNLVANSTSRSYTDGGLLEGHTYNYEIVAVNFLELKSSKSAPPVSATTLADNVAPTMRSVKAERVSTEVTVEFSESVQKTSAEAVANYAVDRGIVVSKAVLEADNKTVTLTCSSLTPAVSYALAVSNVKDRSQAQNTIAPNSTRTFQFNPIGSAPPPGGGRGADGSSGSAGVLGRFDGAARASQGDCTVGWVDLSGSVEMDVRIVRLLGGAAAKQISRSQSGGLIDVCQEGLRSGSYLVKGNVNGVNVKNSVVVVR